MFSGLGNTAAHAAIAILLPTLNRFVTMEPWTGAQRAFAVNAFYKNGDSFVIAQCEFRIEFGIHCNRAVPSAHVIKTWVRNFEASSSFCRAPGS